jgi:hypothetical protein
LGGVIVTIEEVLDRKKIIDEKIKQNKEILEHLKGVQDYIDILNSENAELEKELERLFPMKYYPNK